MIKFKICPRCRGDLYLTQDIFGRYLSCLQCGYLLDLKEPRLHPHRKIESRIVQDYDAA